MTRAISWLAGPALVAFALSGCATAPEGNGFSVADPYESFNRDMFEFNTELDRHVLRPVSQAYDFAMPTTLQFVIGNEVDYLSTPVDFANYLLQGELEDAGIALARFTLNTVLGGVGFLDPATEFGLPAGNTDFGITLGKWGVPEGAYLVLPFFGPSMVRGLPAFAVDRAFSPLTWLGYWGPLSGTYFLSPGVKAVSIIDSRAANAAIVDDLLYESPAPYATLRSAYVQRRRVMVAGEEGAITNLPDIFGSGAAQ